MAYTGINKSTDYFNTKLYTGNGSTQSISGVGFEPSLTWLKSRSNANVHALFDAVRGVTKRISSNDTSAEYTEAGALTAFDSDGFSLGNWTSTNGNGHTLASWNWKANGAGSANTDGSVSATVSANTTAGFSIVKYNTAGSGTQTMGHGLGSAPTFIITKPAQVTESWYVYIPTGVSTSLRLNTDAAAVSSTPYAGTPTDTLFSINNSVIGGYTNVISYCFAEKTGYSKFGSYVGNGNADGTFVYTGFKPAWLLIKKSSASGNGWFLMDTKTNTYNPKSIFFQANLSNAETDVDRMDILSNGFKPRYDWSIINESGATYIYMAFAEAPLVGSNNVPCTAR